MEYIVGLIALAAVIYLVTRKSDVAVVETQPASKVEEVNAQPVVEVKQEPAKAPAKKPAAKKPAAPKASTKKPATAKKAPAKKPAARTAKPKA